MRSPNLDLPLLVPAQAQKHVTVNELLLGLDVLAQCAVQATGRNDPPAAPAEGERYLIGAAPTGAWVGQAGKLADWRNGGWAYAAPRPGWRVYDLATDRLLALDSAGAWQSLSAAAAPTELQNATRFGLGATADAANPFVARLNAALFSARDAAEGGTGDLRVVCNKTAAARDAGFIFQTGFITRAVAGLFGSNRFRLSVSSDGASFHDAMTVDEATGVVDLPRLPRFKASTNFDNHAAVDVWTRIAINAVEANDQGAFDATTNRFTAPAAGQYLFGASLLHKINASNTARMRARLVRNGTTQIPGSFCENSATHVTMASSLQIQTVASLAAGDTVELQGSHRTADGYFAANQTTFWGFKVG